MLNVISDLQSLDFISAVITIFVFLEALKLASELLLWFGSKIGIEFKWVNTKQKDHKLLEETVETLQKLNREQDNISELTKSVSNRLKILEVNSMANEKATVEMLFHVINDKCDKYINEYKGIPSDEIIALTSSFESYKNMGGNHGLETKVKYCLEKLPVV